MKPDLLTLALPAAPLQPWVRAYVRYYLPQAGAETLQSHYFPLADTFLIGVRPGSFSVQLHADSPPLPTNSWSVLGQYTTRFRPQLRAPLDVVAVQFRPGGCAALLGVDMAGLMNNARPLAELTSPATLATLTPALDPAAPLSCLDEALLTLADAPATRKAPRELPAILAHVEAEAGRPTVAELARRFHVTERTLLRWYRHAVGVGPKQFGRIVRFVQAVQVLEQTSEAGWTEVLQACGYTDQAHFIREFRAFSGQSPGQFRTGYVVTREHLRGLRELGE
ncbi:AraC family transcriptional regulator [Hymenobacter sp. BT175]|uniref:helix-turn-helix domain-containing protein n=1 Tax=Hymenobacter translucens TaxID=2886507 RepID=UPI001D0E35D3|nr:AraC family transcriptional regulator [Hymenobacter translucens]MCC2545914.1 AraC family transcriptional regulator [Hymenobacter translucens]